MSQHMHAGTISRTIETSSLETRLEGKWLRAAKITWIILMLVALTFLITSLPGYISRINSGLLIHSPGTEPGSSIIPLQIINTVISLASSVLSLLLSLLLFQRRFRNPAVAAVSFYLLLYSVILTGPLEAWGAYWVGNIDFVFSVQALLLVTPTIALLVLFPNGTFVPSWTRWLLAISLPPNIISVFYTYSNDNIRGLIILGSIWFILLGLGLYAQVYRYRWVSSPAERQQTKWVLFGFSLWLGYILVSIGPYIYLQNLPVGEPRPWWAWLNEIGWWASLNIIPVTLTIAITRSGLWNIDIVINRTLVYGVLTFTTILIYIFVVSTLGVLLNTGNNTFVAFLTTGLIAVLFQPLRDRLQSWINRLMYGERDDPVAVLTKLGEQIEKTGSPGAILDNIVEMVGKTLKIPYVAIELGDAGDHVASFGTINGEPLRLPLVYQGKAVGNFVFEQRSKNEPFSSKDLQLLENITRQVGVAAHNVSLTADLQRSRQRIVTAREEERRRLRRDLHDGLGPQLASQTLTLNAIEKLIDRDPESAKKLIQGLKTQSQDAINSIRHLIYELRPHALDELGLVEAIKEVCANYRSAVNFEIDAPESLPPLPAAAEVSAYHITQEAVVNVIRHAHASNCRIAFKVINESLYIEIKDDGQGIPEDPQVGIGLQSMQERVDELNGHIEFKSLSGEGTCVCVWLPIISDEQ